MKESKAVIIKEIDLQKVGLLKSKFINRWATHVSKEYDADPNFKKKAK